MSAATSPPPLPSTILAQRYRLERRLAQGGMAEVWLATDTALSRQVAVKLLKPNLAADPVVAERFRREAIAVAGLNHPNIVAVYDAIDATTDAGGRQAVVMQLVNGKSLRQLLDEQKKLSPELTIHIGSCVASALDAAHRAQLVHRDVKPGNILITPDGRVLLTDFGIAKAVESTGDDLTSDNVMMGTAKYLSPEQVRGKRLDGRADLYALGLVLYECLAGRVPFLGETDADTALARLRRDPTDIARLRPTLPDGLADAVHRLLARRPDDRYASGSELRVDLQRIAANARLHPGGNPADATGSATPPLGRPSNRATTGRVVGQPIRVDRTPPQSARPRPQTNRQFQQRPTASVVIVGLLMLGLIVALVLWATVGSDPGPTGNGNPSVTSTVPGADTPLVSASGGPTGAAFVAATAYDPDGDGEENDSIVGLAIDGNAATSWNTLCYSSKFLGGKGGVGLVVELTASTAGTVSINVDSAPWQLEVFTSSQGTVPSTIDGWGTAAAKSYGDTPKVVTAPIASGTRYVLALFHEVAPDPGCTDKNRNRGRIGEVTFTANA